jgi:hypothetical protein
LRGYSCFKRFSLRRNGPKPVVLSFDCLDNAVQCPLPDSEPTTPEKATANSDFKLPENPSSNIEYQCKLIQIEDNHSFYLIRYDHDKPYIPCFNLARLLHLSESDILSETVRILILNILFKFFFSYYHVFVFNKQMKIVQYSIFLNNQIQKIVFISIKIFFFFLV